VAAAHLRSGSGFTPPPSSPGGKRGRPFFGGPRFFLREKTADLAGESIGYGCWLKSGKELCAKDVKNEEWSG